MGTKRDAGPRDAAGVPPLLHVGDAVIQAEATLADLVSAYSEQMERDLASMAQAGEITADERDEALRLLDERLRAQFGPAPRTRPTVPPSWGGPAWGGPVARGLDPKGRLVLSTARDRHGDVEALIYKGGRPQPFVVAHGYDAETGEWGHGSYFASLEEARGELDRHNPDVLGSARLDVSDLAEILVSRGFAPCRANLAQASWHARLLGCPGAPSDVTVAAAMAQAGRGLLEDVVTVLAGEGELEPAPELPEEATYGQEDPAEEHAVEEH